MYLIISFIFVEDGGKGSELEFRNDKNKENRGRDPPAGYWGFSASAASGFWWMFQDVKTALHVTAIIFSFSKQMVLLSRRKGRTIQASHKTKTIGTVGKLSYGYGCIGTFGMSKS